MTYYCPYCKKNFRWWGQGHQGIGTVCYGGCNTPQKDILQMERERLKEENNLATPKPYPDN